MGALRLSGKNQLKQKFDREIWREELAFECYGVKFGIRSNRTGFLQSENDFLPYNSKPIALGTVEHLFSLQFREKEIVYLYDNEEEIKLFNLASFAPLLKARMRHRAAAETVEKVFIHAGVAAWNDKLIVLPANGYGGKTTLTAELVKAGAAYYSDEFAVLDEDGLVYPYPKPLSMRERNSLDGAQTEMLVEHFGGQQATAPLPINLVVLTEYKPRGRWQPQVLSPGQAIIEMLKFTNSSLKNPEMAIKVLKKIAIQATIVKTVRGDAARAARAIINLCQKTN